MPPVEISKSDKDEAAVPVSKPVIGIIYPPPEVRNIVDKTASFVARNGPEFETRIRQNELNNPKFNFLAPSDPYHAYYKHKVKEFQEGRGQEPSAIKTGFGYMLQKPLAPEQIKAAVEVQMVREPPAEFEFIADPPSISAFDLDMVKLTAQFVARNGRQFLTNLMKMEARNYQFDFLRPQHSLFNYFTKLVEQYTKILIPPKDLIPKLRKEAESHQVVLDQVKYRMEWAKHQERERKREEEEKEKERVAYAQIDWHDFVVVETVDYQPNETGNLPPPTTPDEVGARMLLQQRYDEGLPVADDDVEPEDEHSETEDVDEGEDEFDEEDEVVTRGASKTAVTSATTHHPVTAAPVAISADTRVQDMDEESETESDEDEHDNRKSSDSLTPGLVPPPPPPPVPKDIGRKLPPLPPNPEHVIIRKDYNPKAPKAAEHMVTADKFLISPITGEHIPADKIQQHIHIGLLDSKWIEQRDRAIAERREQEEVYAPGSAIGDQLKHLAERRTDIFGSGAEETQIGKKIGEEEKKEKAKVIWDGHSASMEKVSQKARENITIEDQIAVIHKVKGLLPDEDKEKIGPAMPKFDASLPPPPPLPVSTTPVTRQPAPPPVRTSLPPVPPRIPVVSIPVPLQPGLVMMPQTTPAADSSAKGDTEVRRTHRRKATPSATTVGDGVDNPVDDAPDNINKVPKSRKAGDDGSKQEDQKPVAQANADVDGTDDADLSIRNRNGTNIVDISPRRRGQGEKSTKIGNGTNADTASVGKTTNSMVDTGEIPKDGSKTKPSASPLQDLTNTGKNGITSNVNLTHDTDLALKTKRVDPGKHLSESNDQEQSLKLPLSVNASSVSQADVSPVAPTGFAVTDKTAKREESSESKDADKRGEKSDTKDAEKLGEKSDTKDAANRGEKSDTKDADKLGEKSDTKDTDNREEKSDTKDADKLGEKSDTKDTDNREEKSDTKDADKLGEKSDTKDADKLGEKSATKDADKLGEKSDTKDADNRWEKSDRKDADKLGEKSATKDADNRAEKSDTKHADKLGDKSDTKDADKLGEKADTKDTAQQGDMSRHKDANVSAGGATAVDRNATEHVIAKLPAQSNSSCNNSLPAPADKTEPASEPASAVKLTTIKIQTEESQLVKTTSTTTSLPREAEEEESKITVKSTPVKTDMPSVVDEKTTPVATSTTVQKPVQPSDDVDDGSDKSKELDEAIDIDATQSPNGKVPDFNDDKVEEYTDTEKDDVGADKDTKVDTNVDVNDKVQRPVEGDVKKTVPAGKPSVVSSLKEPEPSSSAFMIYFLVIAAMIVSMYIIYHNRQKLKGLIIEGRQSMNRRQTKRGTYSKLSNKADDVLPTPTYSESIKTYVY